ncbi:MAG TPA: GPW/gp25 family protein [Cytophagaceae bacterium]|jgi:phage baseplate assembly protein W|nr:GPW/gp25 family protein [Cytophagaceae bacterium]
MSNNKSFLGVGWKFPPTFDRRSGSVMLVSEETDIKESLEILLSTRKGERNMLPEFGCNLHLMAFEAINNTTIGQLQSMIRDAIQDFEPRITLDNVDIDAKGQTDGYINIIIYYTINKSNTSTNMVYPYYILEGNDLYFKPIAG